MYQLPHLYLISDRTRTAGRPLLAALQAAVKAGVRLLQLREKDLSPRELYALAAEARALLDPFAATLLINDRVDVAAAVGAGVHLTTRSLPPAAARRCLPVGALIGVSTHSLAEASFAVASGADFLTFGPVFDTPSKAAYGPPRGLDALREVCAAVSLPIYALGGITPARVTACRAAGAYGVAAIGALLEAPDIANAVAAFNCALSSDNIQER
jgi:thiamine-phosphate pyrophosphorylase